MVKKIVLSVFLIICLVCYLNTRHPVKEQLIALTGQTMGTSYHIKVLSDSESIVNKIDLKKKIDRRLNLIDHKMSTYKQDSELSKLNNYPSQQWMPVSSELMHVINAGQQLSINSKGAFDMTIGKLVNLWGFGPTININQIPNAEKIAQFRQQIGYNKLKIQQTPPAILKDNDGLYIDLSAIAKGYAVDAVAKVIADSNIHNFIVEIGGEIITRGHKNSGLPWVVGVESPITNERRVKKKLRLTDAAMATSGDYRNYFEKDGIRYSHTIDPRTGYPIKHKLASVTVIAENCMWADGLATSLMVMGPDKGLRYAEENNIAIFMLIKHGSSFVEAYSTEFNKYLQSEKIE